MPIRKLVIALIASLALPLSGQIIEITPTVGYTFGDTFDEIAAPGFGDAEIKIEDGQSFGLIFDVGSPRTAFEFTWLHTSTELTTTVGALPEFDYDSDNFQFGVVYYFNERSKTRPFVNGGIGWTDFDIDGQDGDSRFSMSLGGGVSHYFSDRIGIRAQARWIPTYINTDDPYVVCDPFGFCYAVGDDNYLYQVDASVGLVIRVR